MTRWEHYILRAESIIREYDPTVPLHHFLKEFFRRNPKMGSNDRRQVSQLVYGYYRLGASSGFETTTTRIKVATYLFSDQEAYASLRPSELQQNEFLSLDEKLTRLEQLYPSFNRIRIFPWQEYLSPSFPFEPFIYSFLTQPSLFLRIRHLAKTEIEAKLVSNHIPFEWLGNHCLKLPNGTRTENLLPEGSFEVQDYSSQRTGVYFNPDHNESWWDCCAASGGKSLLLKDLEPSVRLAVSDIRNSVLENLVKRFKRAGHHVSSTQVIDLTREPLSAKILGAPFDGIIVDAPCSGSGTWSRNPENLCYFNPEILNDFHNRQLQIALNASRFLKPEGVLIYITCSVFKKENEDVIAELCHLSGLHLEKSELIDGTGFSADSMFVARLKKN
ncbi:MAG: RsmB/NOP family class I SAM-dependent RNA methyltransferase [Bacteroidota bacterium]|nr:RsmB/NOP family class I SAM-dependent RNA methyltransferase [Bacteroidota bacterium]